jgi:hypothetical protein
MASTQSKQEKSLPTDDLSGHSMKQANSDTEEDKVELKTTEASIAISDDYPHGFRLIAIVISLMLGTFLVALDNVSRPI